MKKVLFGLLALSSLVAAKEIVPAPVAVVEAVCPEPVEYKEKESLHNLYLRAGVDLWSQFNKTNWGTVDWNDEYTAHYKLNDKDPKNVGWDIGVEFTRDITKNFELGFGIAYQNHGKFKSVESYNEGTYFDGDQHEFRFEHWYESDFNNFESIPLYLTAKYTFEQDLFFPGWKPYVKADLGYSFNKGDKGVYGEYYYADGITETEEYDYYDEYGTTRIENGLYAGLGLGVQYEDWSIDLMYKLNTAKVKGKAMYVRENQDDPYYVGGWYDNGFESFSKNIRNSRVTLSVAYKFDL